MEHGLQGDVGEQGMEREVEEAGRGVEGEEGKWRKL